MMPHILELLAMLESEHQPGDLYRGQNRDYPEMLPSRLRRFRIGPQPSAPHVVACVTPYFKSDDRQGAARDKAFGYLLRDFGVGPGNIIAQQYGVSSEALDVTSDPSVAAYFATRKYPAYDHHPGPGTGVIYRFRGLTSDSMTAPYSLEELEQHFSSCVSKVGRHTRLVGFEDRESVPEADRWWEHQPSINLPVWTPRFVSDWTGLRDALRADGERLPTDRVVYMMGSRPRAFKLERTRFQSQSGGMIRPRLLLVAAAPSQYTTPGKDLSSRSEWELTLSSLNFAQLRGRSRGAPPVMPSVVLGKRFAGVENLREHPACEIFLFTHSDRRVTGFYRRLLWPEPADDPLYARLWQLGIASLLETNAYNWDRVPAVDDEKLGVFDRGYRLSGERETRDGRENEDLYRGQLEDAEENLTFGQPRPVDHLYHCAPLLAQGDTVGATRAVVQGLRLDPHDADLVEALAECLGVRGKSRWREMAIDHGLGLAPKHPGLLYKKAWLHTRLGNFGAATELLEVAISSFDSVTSPGYDYFLLELRSILALVERDADTADSLLKELRERGYSVSRIIDQAKELIERFPSRATQGPIDSPPSA